MSNVFRGNTAGDKSGYILNNYKNNNIIILDIGPTKSIPRWYHGLLIGTGKNSGRPVSIFLFIL